jgi:thiol-disulfide isomerase/thioredoxin
MFRLSGARLMSDFLTLMLIAITVWEMPAAAASDPPPTLVGQVTCSSCWSEADRTVVSYGGEADRACAARCAAAGIPPAIAVRGEEGGFRLVLFDGPPPEPHGGWLDLIAEFVRVVAVPTQDGHVRVTSLELLDASPWPPPAASNPEDLRWRDLTGVEQSIAALRGRIAVVNFWATWCAPCVAEMPVLAGIQADYGLLGVQVVGISADSPDDTDRVLAFARKNGLTFPLWLGATAPDMASFEVGPALPATVVIDRDGHVVHRVHGVVEDEALRQVLDRVIRGDDAETAASGPEMPKERVARAPDEAALVPS